MRKRFGILTALLVILGTFTNFVFADDYDLQIITPHNKFIQEEFERAFVQHVGKPVRIRWIVQGTGELLKMLDAKERAVKGGSFDLDVFFGGGVPDHSLAATRGYLETPNLPKETLDAIPPQIAGVINCDEKRLWLGSALSAFGILSNRRGLGNQKLPEIQSWEDLAQPRMFSWVSIADPRKSSSVRVCYELVLQKYGWEKGWPLLMQIAANARKVMDTSTAVPNEIASGDALAGPCIDFYGYSQMVKAGPDVLVYLNPPGASAITPDPIAMLRKPPHREMAEKFIAFVLSQEGQALWCLPVGAPGGPAKNELRRMPIRPDVCEKYASQLVVKDPYKEAAAGAFMPMNDELEKARTTLLADLMGAALIDLHGDAKDAWKALIDGGMKPAALAEWNKLPFTEQEGQEIAKKLAAGDREAQKIKRGWTAMFKEKYEKVKKLAK